jgi:hypothetical protein
MDILGAVNIRQTESNTWDNLYQHGEVKKGIYKNTMHQASQNENTNKTT